MKTKKSTLLVTKQVNNYIFICAVSLIASVVLGLFAFLLKSESAEAILFESLESRAVDNGPVFNRIKLISSPERDIWLMQQSHSKLSGSWDRLAIIVDKSKSPKQAQFVQYEDGPLVFREGQMPREFRVSCFMCHPNGPRLIRPNINSELAALNWSERLKIFFWNLKIKSYGRVRYDLKQDQADQYLRTPFRQHSGIENESLNVAACTRCHNEKNADSRGPLFRQNRISIQFMIENGLMPPRGKALSPKDRKNISDFLNGFEIGVTDGA